MPCRVALSHCGQSSRLASVRSHTSTFTAVRLQARSLYYSRSPRPTLTEFLDAVCFGAQETSMTSLDRYVGFVTTVLFAAGAVLSIGLARAQLFRKGLRHSRRRHVRR